MRLWTLQAPEVVTTLRSSSVHRAEWGRIIGGHAAPFRDMTDEMGRRGINCHGAPPVWCWPGRALRRNKVRNTADSLLSLPEWARGPWLLKLDVPKRFTLATSYSVWNDYLAACGGFLDGPDRMDWTGSLQSEYDEHQVTIPELRIGWLIRARPFPPDAEITARIAADPLLREQFGITGPTDHAARQ